MSMWSLELNHKLEVLHAEKPESEFRTDKELGIRGRNSVNEAITNESRFSNLHTGHLQILS